MSKCCNLPIHLTLWREIFPHNYACATTNIFEKTRCSSIRFFFLRNNHILTKVITFRWKYIKNKRNGILDTFLDFADFSSYTFKLSAWNRGCAISLELQITNFLDPILESSYKVLLRKVKTEETFYGLYSFYGSLNFSINYLSLLYKYVVPYNHLWRNIFKHIYAYMFLWNQTYLLILKYKPTETKII